MPSDFSATSQPAYMDIRLCPQPDCPNSQLPPSTSVRLLRDNVVSRSVGLLCTACGCKFVRRHTGELVPVCLHRSPIPLDNKRELTKPTKEVALLLELGHQECTNQEIAQRLGWQMATITWYWYALSVDEAVHHAQKRRRREKREQRLVDLRMQAEMILATLCQQEEPITLSAVGKALGVSLDYYDKVKQYVRTIAEEHNHQCQQRRTATLRILLESIIADLPDQTGRVTFEMMATELGLTSAQLHRNYPELAALARTATRKQQVWFRGKKRQRRCVHIREVAASLSAQDQRLTIKGLQREAGIAPYVYQSDTIIRDLIQQLVWYPTSKA